MSCRGPGPAARERDASRGEARTTMASPLVWPLALWRRWSSRAGQPTWIKKVPTASAERP
eukprot:1881903-Alexandrium_andersonii.AAC.1